MFGVIVNCKSQALFVIYLENYQNFGFKFAQSCEYELVGNAKSETRSIKNTRGRDFRKEQDLKIY